MTSKAVRCTGWDDYPLYTRQPFPSCDNKPEPGTDLCTECRKDIEWLHAPLTDAEKFSIDKATKEIIIGSGAASCGYLWDDVYEMWVRPFSGETIDPKDKPEWEIPTK